MRHLRRGQAPACLSNFRHGTHNWSNVSTEDKTAIWAEIDAMQGVRCAYCECDITSSAKHIEHFVQRSRNPALTFTWSNLFGSCNRKDSCGKHKDERGRPYNDADLIKPDAEDPEALLVFEPLGAVRPRKGLSPADTQRAAETIRVFNLDGVVRAIRRSELGGYLNTAEEFAEMAKNFSEEEWLPLLQEEISRVAGLPFATAIKHVLTQQSRI